MICTVGAAPKLSKDIWGTVIGLEAIRIGALDDCVIETDVSPRNGHRVSDQKIPAEGGK
jgi:hypothetical protein